MGDRESVELVRRAQAGDEAALTTLFDEHAAEIRAQVHRRLSPRVRRRVADSDVMQEAMIVAAQRLGDFEYQGPGSFRRWLAQIAENSALKVARRHLTQKRDVNAEVWKPGSEVAAAQGARLPSPSDAAMGAELQDQVLDAVRELPEDYQTVIHLLQNRRMTIADAAELMGRTPNAIKKLHARALSDLADRLGI